MEGGKVKKMERPKFSLQTLFNKNITTYQMLIHKHYKVINPKLNIFELNFYNFILALISSPFACLQALAWFQFYIILQYLL